MQLFRSTPKHIIPEMPRYVFDGRIVVIQSEDEARKALQVLKKEPLVGIDTETRPVFKQGVHHKVALLQISTPSICFLFRLNFIGLPPFLVDFLASEDAPLKIGLSLVDDWHVLRERVDFEPAGYLDLQPYVKSLGLEDLSLQKLYANLFHQRISKRARLSNWEADVLSHEQQLYAATDAAACIHIYERLEALRAAHELEIIDYDSI